MRPGDHRDPRGTSAADGGRTVEPAARAGVELLRRGLRARTGFAGLGTVRGRDRRAGGRRRRSRSRSGLAAISAVFETLPPARAWSGRRRATRGRASLLTRWRDAGASSWSASTRPTPTRRSRRARAPTCSTWRPPATRWWRSPSSTALCAGALRASRSTGRSPARCCSAALSLGADYAIQSATKFIGGHSDLLLGVVSTEPARGRAAAHVRAQLGATPGALEAWLALRGLRTLPARLEVAQRNAQTPRRAAERTVRGALPRPARTTPATNAQPA